MTCTTCAHATTRGEHVYCDQVGACVCRYVAIDKAPSWCVGWKAKEGDAKRCADVAIDEVTRSFHTGKL